MDINPKKKPDPVGKLHPSDIQKLQQAREYLSQHLDTSVTVQELSEQIGLSPTKLKVGFKLLYGNPVHKTHVEMRLQKAKKLLEDPRLSILEIALKTGFKSVSYFTTAFKKQFYYSPSYLRR